jgi:NAD-dependent DNA ligase
MLRVDPGFVAQEKLKAKERRRRFEAATEPPPTPKRSVAWPGGKIITPNKAGAIASFLERKAGSLDKDKERALRAELERAAATSPAADAPLAGLTFALSAGGDDGGTGQAELARTIRAAGGTVSNTVHKKVHLLVASEWLVLKPCLNYQHAHRPAPAHWLRMLCSGLPPLPVM